jgi:hypothetical protein
MNDELYETIREAVRDALPKQPKAEPPKKEPKNQILEAAFIFFAGWFGITMMDYLSHARWLNKFRYAVWYSVDSSQIQQPEDKPPSDCDFLKAPIGLKGCYYKKRVEVQEPYAANDNKRSVLIYWSKENADY